MSAWASAIRSRRARRASIGASCSRCAPSTSGATTCSAPSSTPISRLLIPAPSITDSSGASRASTCSSSSSIRPSTPTAGDPMLIADGWVEYPYSQTSFAAWQAGATYDAPTIEARLADGTWTTVLEQIGYPAGMPRRMSLPLVGLPAGTTAIRIRTNQEIYWDRLSGRLRRAMPGGATTRARPDRLAPHLRRLPQAHRRPLPPAAVRLRRAHAVLGHPVPGRRLHRLRPRDRAGAHARRRRRHLRTRRAGVAVV